MNRFVVIIAAAGALSACDSGSSGVNNQLAASAAIAPGSAPANGTRVAEVGLPPIPGGGTMAVASNTPPAGSLQSSNGTAPPAGSTATGGDDGAPLEGGQQRGGAANNATAP